VLILACRVVLDWCCSWFVGMDATLCSPLQNLSLWSVKRLPTKLWHQPCDWCGSTIIFNDKSSSSSLHLLNQRLHRRIDESRHHCGLRCRQLRDLIFNRPDVNSTPGVISILAWWGDLWHSSPFRLRTYSIYCIHSKGRSTYMLFWNQFSLLCGWHTT